LGRTGVGGGEDWADRSTTGKGGDFGGTRKRAGRPKGGLRWKRQRREEVSDGLRGK